MRNIRTKHFDYFQGLKALKCHRTKRLICINYRSKWPQQKTFLRSTPLPPGFPESSTPPPARISRIPSVGGVWIFSGTTHYMPSPKSGPKNGWIPAVAGSGNPLKSRFESKIRAKIFSKSTAPFTYSPRSKRSRHFLLSDHLINSHN